MADYSLYMNSGSKQHNYTHLRVVREVIVKDNKNKKILRM